MSHPACVMWVLGPVDLTYTGPEGVNTYRAVLVVYGCELIDVTLVEEHVSSV